MTFKKYQVWAVLIFILFLLVIWRAGYYTSNDSLVEEKSFNFLESADEKGKKLEQVDNSSQGAEFKDTFLVKRVIDGDTIELDNGERVRYIGIDTPETVDPRKLVQCFGKEAAQANRELVEGKLVRLERDVSDKDRYGRLLRYVYEGDKFINLDLVKNGYAHTYTYPPDVKNGKLFVEAQKIAKENKRGLWGECP